MADGYRDHGRGTDGYQYGYTIDRNASQPWSEHQPEHRRGNRGDGVGENTDQGYGLSRGSHRYSGYDDRRDYSSHANRHPGNLGGDFRGSYYNGRGREDYYENRGRYSGPSRGPIGGLGRERGRSDSGTRSRRYFESEHPGENGDASPNPNSHGISKRHRNNNFKPNRARARPRKPNSVGMKYEAAGIGDHVPGTAAKRIVSGRRTMLDDTGKERKFVPKGRIIKNTKNIEKDDEEDLYCETCEQSFQDKNGMISHLNGRKHKRNFDLKREEAETPSDEEEIDPIKVLRENIDSYDEKKWKSIANQLRDDKNKPTTFESWCQLSLRQRAKKGPKPQAVMREILFTYNQAKETGSLLITDWAKMPKATGHLYVHKKPALFVEKAFTEKQGEDMESIVPSRKTHHSAIGNPTATTPSAIVELETTSEPASDDTNGSNVLAEEEKAHVKFRVFGKPTWNVKRKVKKMVQKYQDHLDSRDVESLFYKRHGNLLPGHLEAQKLQPVTEGLRQEAENELKNLEKLVLDAEFDIDEHLPKTLQVVSKLESTGRMWDLRRRTLQVVVQEALGAFSNSDDYFEQMYTAMEKLFHTFEFVAGSNLERSECVAHWIVMLLLKPKVVNPNEFCRHGRYLDMHLAQMHQSFFQTSGLKYALPVISAALRGEYATFFKHYHKDPFHVQCERRTVTMLDRIMTVVRADAFFKLGQKSQFSELPTYRQPIGFHCLMRQLGYFDDEGNFESEDALEEIANAGLQHVAPNDGSEDDGVVAPSNTLPSVEVSPLVNAELMLGFARKKNTILCKFLKTE